MICKFEFMGPLAIWPVLCPCRKNQTYLSFIVVVFHIPLCKEIKASSAIYKSVFTLMFVLEILFYCVVQYCLHYSLMLPNVPVFAVVI